MGRRAKCKQEVNVFWKTYTWLKCNHTQHHSAPAFWHLHEIKFGISHKPSVSTNFRFWSWSSYFGIFGLRTFILCWWSTPLSQHWNQHCRQSDTWAHLSALFYTSVMMFHTASTVLLQVAKWWLVRGNSAPLLHGSSWSVQEWWCIPQDTERLIFKVKIEAGHSGACLES